MSRKKLPHESAAIDALYAFIERHAISYCEDVVDAILIDVRERETPSLSVGIAEVSAIDEFNNVHTDFFLWPTDALPWIRNVWIRSFQVNVHLVAARRTKALAEKAESFMRGHFQSIEAGDGRHAKESVRFGKN